MLGIDPNLALSHRRRVPTLTLCLAVLAGLLPGPRLATAQTPSPAPFDPTLPAEPTLPTDPTAPAMASPTATSPGAPTPAPAIPLIPAPPLNPLEPPPTVARPAPPLGTGALPGGTLDEPPAPTPAAPNVDPAATTNNIGTARRFQYLFAATLGATYDDNIFLEPSSSQRSDFYFTIQPTVVLGLGGGLGGSPQDNTLRFSYSPQVLLYVDHTELNTVQHFVSLGGSYHLPRLTLTGSQDVQILDSTDVGNPHPASLATSTPGAAGSVDPNTGLGTGTSTVANTPSSNVNLDVGTRSRLNLYNTSLGANYYVSDKVSYDLSGQLSISDYQGALLSSTTLSGSGFFNYSPTGKTTVGAGITAGELFADAPTPDQTFEQGNLRLSYVPSFKLTFSGQIGFELRQSSARGGTDVTPIFALNAAYSPFDGTSVALSGNRQVQASAVLGGQDYEITGFTLSGSQRFFQRAYVRLSIGYTHTDYRAEVNNLTAAGARSDDYFFVQPGLDVTIRDNVTLGVFYSHRASSSTQANRDFQEDQAGLRLSGSF